MAEDRAILVRATTLTGTMLEDGDVVLVELENDLDEVAIGVVQVEDNLCPRDALLEGGMLAPSISSKIRRVVIIVTGFGHYANECPQMNQNWHGNSYS